jgi:hypothetical protein
MPKEKTTAGDGERCGPRRGEATRSQSDEKRSAAVAYLRLLQPAAEIPINGFNP